MKKILILLICFPLIFTSCQKEEKSSSSSSSSSTLCGSADVDFDGTNYTYNNPNILPGNTFPNGCIVYSTVNRMNGDIINLSVGITNMKANNYETDWTLSISLAHTDILANNGININQTYYQNSNASNTLNDWMIYFSFSLHNSPTSYDGYTNTAANGSGGEFTITSIDYINETIDGHFEFTGHPVMGSGSTKQISGQFSDIPIDLLDL